MRNLLFMNIGIGEIVIIALVILLLFGGKKIPELMKGLGKGVKSFKDGLNEKDENKNTSDSETCEKASDSETSEKE
jgi:sec-independent protein translocase protein TatA